MAKFPKLNENEKFYEKLIHENELLFKKNNNAIFAKKQKEFFEEDLKQAIKNIDLLTKAFKKRIPLKLNHIKSKN